MPRLTGADEPRAGRGASAASELVPDGLRPYFADVQDHADHVLAELDTYRDLLGRRPRRATSSSAFNRLGLYHASA